MIAADRFFPHNLLGLSIGLASVVASRSMSGTSSATMPGFPTMSACSRRHRGDDSGPRADPHRASAGAVRAALKRAIPADRGGERAAYRCAGDVAIRGGQPFGEEVLAADPDFFTLLRSALRVRRWRARARRYRIGRDERTRRREIFRRRGGGRRASDHLRLPEPREFVVSAVFRDHPGRPAIWISTSSSRSPPGFGASSDGA